jgi:hypothetical protein
MERAHFVEDHTLSDLNGSCFMQYAAPELAIEKLRGLIRGTPGEQHHYVIAAFVSTKRAIGNLARGRALIEGAVKQLLPPIHIGNFALEQDMNHEVTSGFHRFIRVLYMKTGNSMPV